LSVANSRPISRDFGAKRHRFAINGGHTFSFEDPDVELISVGAVIKRKDAARSLLILHRGHTHFTISIISHNIGVACFVDLGMVVEYTNHYYKIRSVVGEEESRAIGSDFRAYSFERFCTVVIVSVSSVTNAVGAFFDAFSSFKKQGEKRVHRFEQNALVSEMTDNVVDNRRQCCIPRCFCDASTSFLEKLVAISLDLFGLERERTERDSSGVLGSNSNEGPVSIHKLLATILVFTISQPEQSGKDAETPS
jgi:hypothetical protein